MIKNGASLSNKKIENLQGITISDGSKGCEREQALKFFRDFYRKVNKLNRMRQTYNYNQNY